MLSNLDSKTNIFKIILAEFLILALGIGLYSLFPFASLHLDFTDGFTFSDNVLFNSEILIATAVVYLFYFSFKFNKHIGSSRAFNLYCFLTGKKKFKEIKNDSLILLLKFQFIPLMYLGMVTYMQFLYDFCVNINENTISRVVYFNSIVFPVFLKVVMILALAVYSFGYMVESEKYKTIIKSIDNTYIGWIVTIICYLPTYVLVFYIIPMASEELPFFKNQNITAVFRAVIMLVLLFKLWAIFNLGGKSSNLTNRGIVTSGAYRIIRHPHYLAKLIIWWLCALPTLYYHWYFVGGMIFWTVIYVLRALTEEQHLTKDKDYKAYKKIVRWKFIPFVY